MTSQNLMLWSHNGPHEWYIQISEINGEDKMVCLVNFSHKISDYCVCCVIGKYLPNFKFAMQMLSFDLPGSVLHILQLY